uniref:Uncharacterized protein n=1 Tax=Rhizophagus irregularis (strain DAOM 181602 / DAOM 197198 / MUCL 43194) TaxID=747089 RepID=U9TE76_RHIID
MDEPIWYKFIQKLSTERPQENYGIEAVMYRSCYVYNLKKNRIRVDGIIQSSIIKL